MGGTYIRDVWIVCITIVPGVVDEALWLWSHTFQQNINDITPSILEIFQVQSSLRKILFRSGYEWMLIEPTVWPLNKARATGRELGGVGRAGYLPTRKGRAQLS